MSVEAMAKHVATLCAENQISVASHSNGGRAFRKDRLVKIRPVKSAVTYAIALHEVGHVLGPMQNGARLEKEAGAWLWARNHAALWTPLMQEQMVKSLRSYLRWAQRNQDRRRCRPVLPERGHVFWTLVGDVDTN